MTSNEDIIKYVYNKMYERWKENVLESEADFLVGAISAMTAMEHGLEPEKIWSGTPPHWFWYIRSGRSIVAQNLRDVGLEAKAQLAETRMKQYHNRLSQLDRMVSYLHYVVNTLKPISSYALISIREQALDILTEMEEIEIEEEE